MRYSEVDPSCRSQGIEEPGDLDNKDFMNDTRFIYSKQRCSGSASHARDLEQIQGGR